MKRIVTCLLFGLIFALYANPTSAIITTSSAEVSWDEVTTYTNGELIPTGVDVGYIVKWGTQSKNYTELHDAGWDQLKYNMTGLVPGTTYYISARAYTSLNEESGDSPEYVYLHIGAPRVPVYRFLNIKNWAYQFTISESEKNYIISNLSATWKYEGIQFYVYANRAWGTVPVYRFLNIKNWAYQFTISESEKNYIISNLSATWKYEGIQFYVGVTKYQ